MAEVLARDVRPGMMAQDDTGTWFKVREVCKGFVKFDTPSGRRGSVIITYEDGAWEQVPDNAHLQMK